MAAKSKKVQQDQHIFAEHRIVSLDSLEPHPRNYKQHPPKQIAKLKASLQRFGQRKDIVIQPGPVKNLIVAGHGTVLAAKELEWTEISASLIPSDWSQDDIVGYMVADNETANDAEDDETLLASLLEEQRNSGYSLESLGSSDEELDALLERLGSETLKDSPEDNEEKPDVQFKEYDESIEEGMPTELCQQCGKLCLKAKEKA